MGSSEIWVDINAYVVDYYMTVVEKQATQQDVTVDAKAMADGLTATGHVEVPGIFFESGKSVVKPESDAALKEIAKLLQAKPALKIWVVGHTDSVRLAGFQSDALQRSRCRCHPGTDAAARR